jgi:hypothetical protein
MTLPVFAFGGGVLSQCVANSRGLGSLVDWGTRSNCIPRKTDPTKPFHLEQISVALFISSPCLRVSVRSFS